MWMSSNIRTLAMNRSGFQRELVVVPEENLPYYFYPQYEISVDSDDISPVLLELIHNLVIGEDIASVNTHEIKKTLTEDQFNHLKKTENVSNCSICMENKKSNIELNCSHTFCKGCIKKWLTEKSNTCPTCRSEV